MALKRTYIEATLTTGETVKERILYADQLAFDNTIRKNGWDPDVAKGPEGNVFLLWSALRRNHHPAGREFAYETFRDDVLEDLEVTREDADTHAGSTPVDEANPDPADPTLATT